FVDSNIMSIFGVDRVSYCLSSVIATRQLAVRTTSEAINYLWSYDATLVTELLNCLHGHIE
ncbi:hypothetical protein HAX54_010902, partial [Datura stramonium]|nr:hypothetical protein [Datura stramonium]